MSTLSVFSAIVRVIRLSSYCKVSRKPIYSGKTVYQGKDCYIPSPNFSYCQSNTLCIGHIFAYYLRTGIMEPWPFILHSERVGEWTLLTLFQSAWLYPNSADGWEFSVRDRVQEMHCAKYNMVSDLVYLYVSSWGINWCILSMCLCSLVWDLYLPSPQLSVTVFILILCSHILTDFIICLF